MKEVFYLVAPELALVFYFSFAGEILYDQDRLIGHLGFLDAEFEVFFFRSVGPMEADELYEFGLHHFGALGGAVPGEAEDIIPVIHFICEPLLQPGGNALKLV